MIAYPHPLVPSWVVVESPTYRDQVNLPILSVSTAETLRVVRSLAQRMAHANRLLDRIGRERRARNRRRWEKEQSLLEYA